MNSAPNPTDSSLLLWLVAAAVAVLGSHVAQRWMLVARSKPPAWLQWPALLAAGGTFGTTVTATMLLGTAAQGLMFPIGYQPAWVFGLWLGTVFACMPLALGLATTDRWWLVLPLSVALAGLTIGQQAGWLFAAGFRPGIKWHETLLAAAVLTEVVGLGAAAWLSFTPVAAESPRRRWWLLGAAAIAGLSVTGGQELLIAAAGLPYQIDSIYRARLSNSVLCLVAGVLVPMVLVMATVDLALRAPLRTPGSGDSKRRRRKRRHRIRPL